MLMGCNMVGQALSAKVKENLIAQHLPSVVLPPGFPSARCHPSFTRSLGSRISPSDSPIIPNFLLARTGKANQHRE